MVVKYDLLLRDVVPLLLPFVVRKQLLTEEPRERSYSTLLSAYRYRGSRLAIADRQTGERWDPDAKENV